MQLMLAINKLYRLYNKVFLKWNRIFRERIDANLLIFDDIFPNPYSDWRTNEYVYYLKNIPNVKIVTGQLAKNNEILLPKSYENDRIQFNNKYHRFTNNILPFKINHEYKAELGYCLFFNNLKYAFPLFAKYEIPFVFTLYPGGGFKIYDQQFENDLRTYFASKLFRNVIVNMPHVYDYLITNFELDPNKITYIYGGPLEFAELNDARWNRTDNKLKIVFSSHKYMNNGLDKGFDIFNKVAKYFENNPLYEFTVIGGFNKNDLIVKTNNIEFKSEVMPQNLSQEFSKYDIILSPNRSHVLYPGAFDGFPTGSVGHAAMSGCLMMLTDDWDNAPKIGLINNVDYIKISFSVHDIISQLKTIEGNKDKIKNMALNGRKKLLSALKLSDQYSIRLDTLKLHLTRLD